MEKETMNREEGYYWVTPLEEIDAQGILGIGYYNPNFGNWVLMGGSQTYLDSDFNHIGKKINPILLKKKSKHPLERLDKWSKVYDFNCQIYNSEHNIFVSKQDVDLTSTGGHDNWKDAVDIIIKYLNRVNQN